MPRPLDPLARMLARAATGVERLLARVRRRLRYLLAKRRLDGEMDEEIRFHLEMETEENVQAGMEPEEARRRAVLAFGAVERYKDEARDARGTRFIEDLARDVRYGVRSLRRAPGFTAVAVLTLALGIGATTAIFSIVDGVLLRPLDYPDADRIVRVRGSHAETGDAFGTMSYPDFRDLEEQAAGSGAGSAPVFEAIAAQHGWQPILVGAGDPERIEAASVTADWFAVLGVQPASGRFFTPQEDAPGAARSVVLSHGFWSRRFGGDPDVVGRGVTLGGQGYTVVGVAERFEDPRVRPARPEVWRVSPAYFGDMERGGRSFNVIARLRPEVALERAQAEVGAILRRLEAAYPETNAGREAVLVSLKDEIVGPVRPALLMLLAAVGLVLLVACANVANLLLARATARTREFAVRTALGASGARVVRQLLTESLVLALAGGAAGVALAFAATDLLVTLGGVELPRLAGVEVDGRVLAFALGVSVLTGTLFGFAPGVGASRTAVGDALRERTSAGDRRRGRLRTGLVAGQVAIALVVVVGAGLLVRSLWSLTRVDPGLEPARVLTLETQLPPAERYSRPAGATDAYDRMLDAVAALPGVESVGAVDLLPMSGNFNGLGFMIEGRPPPSPAEAPRAEGRAVTPGYFRTLRIPLLRGRAITPRDDAAAPPVVVINESMARRHWPDADPLGARLSRGPEGSWEVVGVVGDVRQSRLAEEPVPTMYFATRQAPGWMQSTSRFLVVRAASDPVALAPAVRAALRSVEPLLAIDDTRTMDGVIAGTFADARFRTTLLALFAAAVLVLGAVGIYGVVAHGVARRTRELAVRKALGARPGSVIRGVIARAMVPVLAGLGLGAVGAWAVGRLFRGLLFEVGPGDPVAFTGGALLLAAVGLLASYIPARRATRVDPMTALRAE